ncbi:MAG: outer membrane lipoprotein-sorting protein [Nevskia sp.]
MKGWQLLWAGLVLVVSPVRADDGVQKVLDCMRANIPETLRIQQVELTATDRAGGNRTLKGKVYVLKDKGLTRAMLLINAPSDLSGAAYLMRQSTGDRDDEIYFYLPAVNRVRRISGASADSALLGTDFSYNDMKELQNAFAGSAAKLEPPETLEQRPTYVLSLSPPAGTASRYSTVKAWIDQKSCIALKVEFFEGKTLRKELSAPAAALQQSGKYWYASEAQMRDLKDNTKTRLRIVGVTGGAELPSRLFDPHTFYVGG